MAALSMADQNKPGVKMWFNPDGTADQGRVEYVGVHEFGHVLGFLHEQDSPDNLQDGPAYCNQTGGVDPKFDPVTGHDKDSVMNYCNRDGNMKGKLTALDIAEVRWLYGQDPARAGSDRTPVEAAVVWSRRILLHVSNGDAMVWGSIENGEPTDEVWLDRSWDGGRTWNDGSKLGDTIIPPGARAWRTMMFSIDDPNPANQHNGSLRACGKAGNRPEIVCTRWMTVCDRECDGFDPARATGDRLPVGVAAVWSRQIALHQSDREGMVWASIGNGNPTDEVWLDRSWDGGRTWADGSKLGDTVIPAAARAWRTMMFNLSDRSRSRSAVLRACGKAGNRAEIACTAWSGK
jgi:hypothetical protein